MVRESLFFKSTTSLSFAIYEMVIQKETPKISPMLTIPMPDSGISERRWFIIMYIFPVKAEDVYICNKKSETISAAY